MELNFGPEGWSFEMLDFAFGKDPRLECEDRIVCEDCEELFKRWRAMRSALGILNDQVGRA